jgi:hypothetical protein
MADAGGAPGRSAWLTQKAQAAQTQKNAVKASGGFSLIP